MTDISRNYFKWLTKLVADKESGTHTKLLQQLYETPFRYSIDRDGNREADGINLRYRFGIRHRIQQSQIASRLDSKPCSVLEVMIALAVRLEEDIMANDDFGNRTSTWFWSMIRNCGLITMVDHNYRSRDVDDIIQRVLDRDYEYDGFGGFFCIPDIATDMRTVEIWKQALWYLNDILRNGA